MKNAIKKNMKTQAGNHINHIFLLLIFILLIVIIISGCGRTYNTERESLEEIQKGSDGLVMEFIENVPPEEVMEGSMFQAAIRINNLGMSDVKGGYLLLGYEKEYLNLYSWRNIGSDDRITINLDGKSLSNPEGSEKVYIANIEARDIGIQREKAETSFFATTCYDYKTDAYANICVDTDPYDLKTSTKACSAEDVSLSDQGAPVAVTEIEYRLEVSKDMGIVKPEFKIHFSNVGEGTIISKGKSSAACSAQALEKGDINTLQIKAHLSETELTCKPEIVKLNEVIDYTICTLEAGIDDGQQSYYAPLSITLEYGYTDSISKTITIIKSIN